MLTAGQLLGKGCEGDKVSHKRQDLDLKQAELNCPLQLDRELQEIEGLILEMTASGVGITNAEITQLYQDTSDELRRLLVRKLGDEEGAEALAQDAYLKLLRIKHNQGIGDLRRYLFSMSVRLALNVLRKRKMNSDYYGNPTSEQAQLTQDRSAYEVLLEELKRETLKERLSQLPEKTRYIYLLYHFKDMTVSEIGKRLTLSENVVNLHLDCAREQTKKALSEIALMHA